MREQRKQLPPQLLRLPAHWPPWQSSRGRRRRHLHRSGPESRPAAGTAAAPTRGPELCDGLPRAAPEGLLQHCHWAPRSKQQRPPSKPRSHRRLRLSHNRPMQCSRPEKRTRPEQRSHWARCIPSMRCSRPTSSRPMNNRLHRRTRPQIRIGGHRELTLADSHPTYACTWRLLLDWAQLASSTPKSWGRSQSLRCRQARPAAAKTPAPSSAWLALCRWRRASPAWGRSWRVPNP
mmetsp:Transcript_72025/g.154170  ORF Transcript_72025/g.154170 Transcript_72025/m.154170 type:complete len:234 (-) Transcript_72025:111-812(-)